MVQNSRQLSIWKKYIENHNLSTSSKNIYSKNDYHEYTQIWYCHWYYLEVINLIWMYFSWIWVNLELVVSFKWKKKLYCKYVTGKPPYWISVQILVVEVKFPPHLKWIEYHTSFSKHKLWCCISVCKLQIRWFPSFPFYFITLLRDAGNFSNCSHTVHSLCVWTEMFAHVLVRQSHTLQLASTGFVCFQFAWWDIHIWLE